VVAVSVSYERIAPGSSLTAGRPQSQQPTFAPAQASRKPPPPPSSQRAAAMAQPSRPTSQVAPRASQVPARTTPPAPPRASVPAKPPAPPSRPLSRPSLSFTLPSRSPAPGSESPRAQSVSAPTRPSVLPVHSSSLPAAPGPLPARPSSMPVRPNTVPTRGNSHVAASASQARPTSRPARLDAQPLASQRPLLEAQAANQQVEPPRSGSQPIVTSHRAGAPPQNEAFESISERLESALQLLRWFEESLSAPPGNSSLDDPRERARALVVFRDIQALVQESKGAADAEAGGVHIPPAPKMPRL
jgi:hypothetical protein